MAKKQPAKPLLATKHDFVDSLDALIQQAIMLEQALGMAFDFAKEGEAGALIVPKPAADHLREQSAKFKALIFQTD